MPADPGRGPAGLRVPDGDDVTRYLCAGAYLDHAFAWDVVDEILLERSRGVAPAPGADVAAVARHSLAAVRRATLRDALLTLIVGGIAVLAGFQGILIAIWIFSWALVGRAVRRFARGELGPALSRLGLFVLITVGGLFVLLLRSGSPVLSAGGLSFHLPLASVQVLGLVVAGLWLVNYLDRTTRYGVLAEQLTRNAFSPGLAPAESGRWRDRLAYITAAQGSALSVYSQDAPTAPFAGFGPVVHTWSVASRLERVAQQAHSGDQPGGSPGPRASLTSAQVYLDLLAAAPGAGFGTGQIVLVPGWLPPGHPFMDPQADRPVPVIPPGVVREIAEHPGRSESFQLIWSSAAPAAGTVASAFVHASIRDDQLALEAALTVLPPVDAQYRAADRFGQAGVMTMVRMLGAALVDVGRRTPQAPVNLARTAWRLWSRRPAQAATSSTGSLAGSAGSRAGSQGGSPGRASAGAGADHGARAGIRELAARRATRDLTVPDYEATRQVNLLSRELTGAIARMLSGHGYDPSGFLRSADGVWQKPLATSPHRGAQVHIS